MWDESLRTRDGPTETVRAEVSAVTEAGVRVATAPGERADAFAVRERVFVDEQGVPMELERDDHDDDDATVHFVAYAADGAAVGAARLRRVGEATGKVERVAVDADRRGEGWGRRLMAAVEDAADDRGLTDLTMHAQSDVVEFYRRLGYEAEGEEFEEAGIPHRTMRKSL